MFLHQVVLGKSYYAIRFSDIAPELLLAGNCFICDRVGLVDRDRVERRWHGHALCRAIDVKLRCLACGNRHHNTFVVAGRRIDIKPVRPLDPPPLTIIGRGHR